jgi:hypothetical protein
MFDETKIREEIEELEPGFDDADVSFDDVKPAKFEPGVNIKTELDFGVYKISEEFDYADTNSGKNTKILN